MRPTPHGPASRALVLLVSLLAAVLAVTTLSTASADTIDDKLDQASDDVSAASAAVTKAGAALERARTQLPAAQAEVAAAAGKLAEAKKAERAAAQISERASDAAVDAAERVTEAEARIVEMNGQIGDLARAVYTQGPYAELAAVLSAQTPSEFADQLQAIRSVSRSQNKALSDFTTAKADLALANLQAQQALAKADASRAQAIAAVDAARDATAQALAAKAKVDALVAARKDALAVAAREKSKVLAQYKALKREQARLRRATSGPGGFTGTPTGGLDWPIPGAGIAQKAGPRIHPVYGYKSCHTGIDIRGGYGTAIRAPADGKVMSIQSGGPYGLHTVVSHGGSLSTMYAHQSRVAVSVGEIVRRGEVIGYVGSSGWVTGPHLHWEVHVNGVPYDPLGWFGGSKSPISCWNG
ncbi:MAG: peptidoglycan DD-metalloendopeptidase family protein [Candidatus Nanopelagicales bacterium]